MKTVYSSPQLFWVAYYQDILRSNGIECVIKNEFLSGGVGELPPNECWPMLLVQENDFERAQQIVQQELNSADKQYPKWTCPRCGEGNEGQFGACWNCGALAPDSVVQPK